ncbi:hypothetical protein D3C59_36420 [Streptomyces sp. SHP22-7]|nr:hypothetical protein D3C59_36420 [Streptomyces sp. SHP22-7]
MAALQHHPRPEALEDIEDPVNYNEASALLARTGHDARPDTIRRWVKEDGIDTVSVRGRTGFVRYVSWTDSSKRTTSGPRPPESVLQLALTLPAIP